MICGWPESGMSSECNDGRAVASSLAAVHILPGIEPGRDLIQCVGYLGRRVSPTCRDGASVRIVAGRPRGSKGCKGGDAWRQR